MGSSEEESQSTELDEPIEFYTWNLSHREETIQNYLSDFENEFGDKYDGLENEWTDRGPETEDILGYFQSRLQSGDPPNLFNSMHTAGLRYVEDDVFPDVEEYAADEYLERYYDGALDMGRVDGTLHMLPFYNTTTVTFYQNQWFKEAGIDPPSLNNRLTTMEYLDAAEEIVENTDAEYGLTLIRFNFMLWSFWASEGIDILNGDGTEAAFNTDRTAEILDRFRELTEAGVMPEVSWTGFWNPPSEHFAAGETAMMHGENTAVRLIQSAGSDWVTPETLGIGPSPENEQYGGIATLFGLAPVATNKSDSAIEASVDLASVITNEKWMEHFMRDSTGLVPHKGVVDSLLGDGSDYADENPQMNRIYDIWGEVQTEIYPSPIVPAATEITQIIDNEFSAAALGEKPVDDAINAAETQVNSALNN